MELTIESMFSPGGLLGNASYILLILSMAMRNMFWLRILAIFSGITGIIYDAFLLHDPVGTFWESCFTIINVVQWIWLVAEKRSMSLNSHEQKIKNQFFPEMDDFEIKQLFNCSKFIEFKQDVNLTEQGEPVEHLYLLTKGKAKISFEGKTVSECQAGDLIGEIGFLTGSAATATATTLSACETIKFDHSKLATLIKSSPELTNSINEIINQGLVTKLIRQNENNIAIQVS